MTTQFSFTLISEQLLPSDDRSEGNAFIDCTPVDSSGHKGDEFVLICNSKDILNFDDLTERDFVVLQKIFEDSPLYQTQMLWIFEQLLLDAYNNAQNGHDALLEACKGIFHPYDIPKAPFFEANKAQGEICYPFLDDLTHVELLQIYASCFANNTIMANAHLRNNLCPAQLFDIKPDRFLAKYKGFQYGGHFKFGRLAALKTARYGSAQPSKTLENYMQEGRALAKIITYGSSLALLKAWANAEVAQIKLASVLQYILDTSEEAKLYRLVMDIVYQIVKHEASKQSYAAQLLNAGFEDKNQLEQLFKSHPECQMALDFNANERLDPHVEKLLSQSLSGEAGCTQSLRDFLMIAKKRDAALARIFKAYE